MNYRSQLIPTSRRQRPGYALRPTTLTVHSTANPNATAAGHANWLGGSNTTASAHIFVDDVEAVLCIPLNEQAWHAGTNAGNTTSIGIEVCEFSDRGRQDRADANAQLLIAQMITGLAPAAFRTTHLSVANVRTHQSWSGKYCPRMLLPWWPTFVAGISAHVTGKQVPPAAFDPEGDGMLFPDFPQVGFIGLHRFHKGDDFVLAATKEQLASAYAGGYSYDGVWSLAPGGTLPLLQCVSGGYHLYVTGNVPEGWVVEGPITNVHPVGRGLTIYRSFKPGGPGHLPSADPAEGKSVGWQYEGPSFGLGVLKTGELDPVLALKAARYDKIAVITKESLPSV